MRTEHAGRWVSWAIGILGLLVLAQAANAQGRNCPEAHDQFFGVASGMPTEIHLDVENLGDGEVSIFQFPLGGVLEQTGPSALDFVFLPGAEFDGTTSFSYRVSPGRECGRNVVLGRVSLAGGVAQGTTSGLALRDTGLCGLGVVSLMGVPVGMGFLRGRRSRG